MTCKAVLSEQATKVLAFKTAMIKDSEIEYKECS